MPKKTRKDKILAQQRKKLRLLKLVSTPPQTQPKPVKLKKQKEAAANVDNPNNEETKLRGYFSEDLKRSLLIVAGIITLEIVIYFATIK